MLKIQRLARGDSVVLAVSGRLDGEAIGALRWAVVAEAGRRVVLDLAEMRLVDREGVSALAAYEAAGVRLERCPEYARRWIDALDEGVGGRD
jgi:anti-anti-sigma regulatory factor